MNHSLDLSMMTTIDFWSPPEIALNCWNPPNAVPILSPQIPILHTNKEITFTNRVTTWYKVK
jgi:hypothetical protein